MRDHVIDVLKSVIDPDVGVNIVDLGLLESLTAEPAGVTVELIMTSPACPQGDYLADEARQRLRQSFSGLPVSVRTLTAPAWTPERMSPEARRQLGWTA